MSFASTSTLPASFSWYAIRVRSRCEKKVSENLSRQGIENYLPLITEVRQWSDRKKKVTVPAISCYVFIRVCDSQKLTVLQGDNVVGFVCENRINKVIPEREINAMKQALSSNRIEVSFIQDIEIGEKVLIESGPLKGYEGIIINRQGKRKYLVRLDNIGYSMIIEK
ncbi:MAG: UpxY family transcription antiterminator [Bacteroidales bacterium]